MRRAAVLTLLWPAALPAQLPPQSRNPVDLPKYHCGYDEDIRRCARRAEAVGIREAGGVVRRSADTLRLTTPARVVTWVDTPHDGPGMARYYYVGSLAAVGDRRYAVVRRDQYVNSVFVLVRWPRGDTVVVPGAPLVSPDRRRLVASTVGTDTDFTLDVWRIDIDMPTREYSTTFPDHMPVDQAWADAETVRFRLRFRPLGGPGDPTPPRKVRLHRIESGRWQLDSLAPVRTPSKRDR